MNKNKFVMLISALVLIGLGHSENIKDVNQNLNILVKQIDNVNKDLKNKQQQKSDLTKAIVDSENAINNASKLLKQLQASRDMNLQQLASLSTQLPQLTDLVNNSKQQVQLAINKIYKQLLVLQQSESASVLEDNSNLSMQRKKLYLSKLLRFEQQRYQTLQGKLSSLTNLNTKLQSEVDRLNKQLAIVAKKENTLKSGKQIKLSIHDNLEQQITSSKSKLSELKKQQAKLNDLVAQLRKAQAKVEEDAKLSRAKNTDSNIDDGRIADNSSLLSRRLSKPVNADVSIEFGDMRDGVKSSGVVFNAPNNSHVYAISNGKVLYSGVLPGFGQLVVIDNGGDYNSIYSGVLSLVKKGDSVKSGQVIASSGVKNNQPMGGVYFELRHLGKSINPKRIFP